MEIKLGKTAIESKRPAAAIGLGGALYLKADEPTHLPERYQIVKTDRMQDLLSHAGSVFGNNVDIIGEQVHKQHPSPSKHGSYLMYYDGQVDSIEERDRSHYHRRHRSDYYHTNVHFEGWFVLDRLYVTEGNLVTLQGIILEHGPVYIPDSVFRQLGGEEPLRKAGFTSVWRRWDMWQINFNPRRTRLHDYRKAVRVFESRSTGEFPSDALDTIHGLLRPQNRGSGGDYPTIRTDDSYSVHFSEIRGVFNLSQRLWPGDPWWRSKSDRYYRDDSSWRYRRHRRRRRGKKVEDPMNFREAILACLPVLHAEEARTIVDDSDKAWFCRFVRREAKALKIPIPPKPREPKKPKPLKGKRRKHAKVHGVLHRQRLQQRTVVGRAEQQ